MPHDCESRALPPGVCERMRVNGADFPMAPRGWRGHIVRMADEDDHDPGIPSLMRCPTCDREMRPFGIEPLTPTRDLRTFERDQCGYIEVRGARIG